MIVTAHQPDLAPWAGYWAKAAASDIMIVMGGVAYSKGERTNRVKVNGDWLTIPVVAGERMIDCMYDPHGVRKARETLKQKLMNKHVPYRARLQPVIDVLDHCMQIRAYGMVDVNLHIMYAVSDILKLDTQFVLDADELYGETKTDRLQNLLLHYAEPTKPVRPYYLSGLAGKDYLEPMEHFDVWYVEGQWPDASILQLIAMEPEPLKLINASMIMTPY